MSVNKSYLLSAVAVSMIILGASCSSTVTNTNTSVNAVVPTRNLNTNSTVSTAEVGSWVPDRTGPWDGSISAVTSTDGLNFSATATTISTEAGVPNLVKLSDGTIVLTYQFFSLTNEDEFDVIAYQTSDDDGNTWSDRGLIAFDDLPGAIDANKQPMDPTLVQLEDGRLRLYFTYHEQGKAHPALYSATTEDDQITSTFIVEPTPALESTEANLLDPAVVYFDGQWHHYTWNDASDDNYHSVSDDGLHFTLEDDIPLPMDFLGQVVTTDEGLRFYGTGKGHVVSASSTDGYTWTMDTGDRVQGADPGVVQLDNGNYLMIYTSLNFNL